MSRWQPATLVPREAMSEVQAIVNAHSEFWGTLRELNRGDRDGDRRTTGADIDGLLSSSDDTKVAEEQLRRKYFPRAARVTVDQWGVYTWSPTGRVVRMVWKLPADERC